MANYPFKINIQTKNGTQLSYYSSSFATSADANVSASAIVDSINALPRAQYTQSEAVPNSLSGDYSTAGANGGKTYLSASHDGAQSGSITFTDTEDSATNGGLDFYTFWGTKVCSVLGLPEGIPIYTENFKFSDNANDPTNYISGDVIADGITVKEGFKLSTQARIRGNLIFDDVFGEGFIQFVSGSVTKMTLGYNDDKDFYKIGGDTNVQISGSSAKINKLDNDGGQINNVDLLRSNGLGGLTISGGTDGRALATYTRGQLYLSHNFSEGASGQKNKANIMVGQTAFRRQSDTVWANNLDIYDYNLILQNDSNTQNAFAGIAFHIENSVDANAFGGNDFSETNNINAVIAALRANSTNTKTASDLIFATNLDDDSDLTERMRITHDGLVGIANDNPSTTLDITGTLNVSSNITTGGTVDGVDVATIGGYLNQAVTTTSSPTFTNLNVATSIIHSGDTDTHIDFGGNSITFDVGNTSVFDMYSGFAIFNEGGGNVDVRMEGQSGAGGAKDPAKLFSLDASLGIICIGNTPQDTNASRLLQVTGDYDGDIVRILNDGDNENRHGMQIRIGTDNGSGTNEYIMFRQGDESAVGLISATSGVVSYGTFTGVHNASILQSDSPSANVITGMPTSSQYHEYPQGTIVSMVSSSYDGSLQPVSFVVSSSAYQDKRAFGVYLGSHNWDDDQRSHAIDKHLIMSVGDGYVLVNSQNGNIETGDYITTASGSGGYGCKQNDDLLHNYTVAKACDFVDWSEESTTYKLLACTYHCG